MLRHIRTWASSEFFTDPCFSELNGHIDKYTKLWFEVKDFKIDINAKYILPTSNLWSPCKIEQFPSCCGIGVIHALWTDSALKYTEFTPEILAAAIKQNMFDMQERGTTRNHYMAVLLAEDYTMWKKTLGILKGKEVRKYHNSNSGNTNYIWEIPSL